MKNRFLRHEFLSLSALPIICRQTDKNVEDKEVFAVQRHGDYYEYKA